MINHEQALEAMTMTINETVYRNWLANHAETINDLFRDYLTDTYSTRELESMSREGLRARRTQFCRHMFTETVHHARDA